MRWHSPIVQADELVLEHEDNTNSGVEPAEVVRHEWQAKSRPADIFG